MFVVDVDGSSYALRCWTRDVGNAADHYRAIDGYLARLQLPYFTNFHFLPEGILVGGFKYPTLRMDWLDGEPLREFVSAHRHDATTLDRTAAAFLAMCQELHRHHIAHGDLQSDNLNVREHDGEIELRLLDYDTLYVPTKRAAPVSSVGIPAYQHPRRGDSKTATEKDDYYSELVIYLTLIAMAEDTGLWDDYRVEARDKELLFSAADLTASQPSALFHRLRKLSQPVSHLTLMLWNFTRHPNILTLPPLEEAVRLAQERISARTRVAANSFDEFLAQNVGKPAGSGRSASNVWFDEWPAVHTLPTPATSHSPRKTASPGIPPLAQDPAEMAFDIFLKNDALPKRGSAVPSQSGAPASTSGTTPTPPPNSQPTHPGPQPPTSENVHPLLGCLFWALIIVIIIWFCFHHAR